MLALPGAPFPVTYRELWLPPGIKDWTGPLPPSVEGGHELTFIGARHGTTADGVHFTGAANSNIIVAAAAGQNAQEAIHITMRFKLDTTFAAGAASNFYLYQKLAAVSDWIRVYLRAADGLLIWEQGDGLGGAGIQFTLTSTTASWAAGVWHIITVSLTNTPTQRLLVNGTVEDTDTQPAIATPNGGNMIIGNSVAAGVDGVIGVISWVVIGVGTTAATALTVAEEGNLSEGIPPAAAKVQYEFLLDEGRGVIAYDRGSAAGNGTIGAVCTWAFGQVQQPVLSLDGINDYARTGANVVDISGNLTVLWVGKMKSTYDGVTTNNTQLILYQNGNNLLAISHPSGATGLRWRADAQATIRDIFFASALLIDQYIVLIGTLTLGGITEFFVNGSLVGTAVGLPTIAVPGLADARISCWPLGAELDISKTLLAAVIEGAFTQKQALAYSRYIRNIMNLPITI